jgi:hypothetical protein
VLTVYLDQNKWIDLAKALYRADAKPADKENAERLRSAVEDGRVRFPVGETHLLEAYRIGDRERRMRLASVLAAFSGGWFIASRQARLSHELDVALRKLLLMGEPSDRPSFGAFEQDFLWAFGESSHLAALTSIPEERLAAISTAVGPINGLLSYVGLNDEQIRRASVVRLKSLGLDLMDRIRSRRALTKSEPADIRFRAYSAQLFLEVQDKINDSLQRMGRTFGDLRALPDEQIVSLIDLVPCWDVERYLAVQIEQQWDREMEENDVYDIAALTAAVPYCDVVVTERLWVHLCIVSGLAERYNVKVISSVMEIAQSVI